MDQLFEYRATVDYVPWIIDRLEDVYGQPERRPSGAPLDELVQTILSQSTTDANCERAFRSLRASFPNWEAVSEATIDEIAAAIRSGGLAQRKAPLILNAVRAILNDHLLDGLSDLPLIEARRRLLSLPGVGPKTAARVLLFACGRPALPVDTHVHRVAGRLGLTEPGTSAEAAHVVLEPMVPPERVLSFHVNLITHGRRVCLARRPQCDHCVLVQRCRFAWEHRRTTTSIDGAS